MMSHDRCGKEVYRLCSSCISSVAKSNGNSIKFSLSNTDKGAVDLILALELASLIPPPYLTPTHRSPNPEPASFYSEYGLETHDSVS